MGLGIKNTGGMLKYNVQNPDILSAVNSNVGNVASAGGGIANNLKSMGGAGMGGGGFSSLGSLVGTAIAPGIGTLIGAGVGTLADVVGAGISKSKEQEELEKQRRLEREEFNQNTAMDKARLEEQKRQAGRTQNMAGLDYLGQIVSNADAATRRKAFLNAIQ